jgi:HEAT repeat protein
VTADFLALPATWAHDGEKDGRRLKELDPKRAAAFLIPFLSKEVPYQWIPFLKKKRPYGLRAKAIGALGKSAFHDAIPELCAIALDTTDEAKLREQALYPGLAYMQHPAAIKTASALASDKLDRVRRSAFWVLANHGTDEAIDVLAGRLRAVDEPWLTATQCASTASRKRERTFYSSRSNPSGRICATVRSII